MPVAGAVLPFHQAVIRVEGGRAAAAGVEDIAEIGADDAAAAETRVDGAVFMELDECEIRGGGPAAAATSAPTAADGVGGEAAEDELVLVSHAVDVGVWILSLNDRVGGSRAGDRDDARRSEVRIKPAYASPVPVL